MFDLNWLMVIIDIAAVTVLGLADSLWNPDVATPSDGCKNGPGRQ
jgi:hypothetical protein